MALIGFLLITAGLGSFLGGYLFAREGEVLSLVFVPVGTVAFALAVEALREVAAGLQMR